MKVVSLYKRQDVSKLDLKIRFDKSSKGKPAWIQVKGLPKGTKFIQVYLGKKGKMGSRNLMYKTYLEEGLFLPLPETSDTKDLEKFYDEWAAGYDQYIEKNVQNINAAKFLLKQLKKHATKGELLDLGAGTGLLTELFVKEGFSPATLVDISEGMLTKAKKRKELRGCKFVQQDLKKLKLNQQFDVAMSLFSVAGSSYFNLEETKTVLKRAAKHLKKNGIIAVLGHFKKDLFDENFQRIEQGIYTLNKEKKYYTDYYIGRRK